MLSAIFKQLELSSGFAKPELFFLADRKILADSGIRAAIFVPLPAVTLLPEFIGFLCSCFGHQH